LCKKVEIATIKIIRKNIKKIKEKRRSFQLNIEYIKYTKKSFEKIMAFSEDI